VLVTPLETMMVLMTPEETGLGAIQQTSYEYQQGNSPLPTVIDAGAFLDAPSDHYQFGHGIPTVPQFLLNLNDFFRFN